MSEPDPTAADAPDGPETPATPGAPASDAGANRGGAASPTTSAEHTRPPTKGELRFYRVIRAILVGACKLWFRASGRGMEHVPAEGSFILAPIHRSNLDFALVLVATKRRMRYLAKDSLWKGQGFWAKVFTALGGIPVARGTADREALRTCIEVVENGEPLVIFPEGTRQSGPEAQHFFDGPAFVQSRTGVPIVPVGIGGSEAAMPKGSKIPKPRKITVVIGAPLHAIEADGPKARRAAIKDRTAELHTVIQDLFDQAQAEAGTPNH